MVDSNKKIKQMILIIFNWLIYLNALVIAVAHKSNNPVIWHFSKNYFLGVIVPVLILCPLFFMFIKFKKKFEKLTKGNKKVKYLIIVFLILVNVAIFIYSGNIGSNYSIRLILPFLVFFFSLFSIYIIYDLNMLPKLLTLMFMFFIFFVFGELIAGFLKRDNKFAQWVDTFKYRSLVDEPFVGEGGRFLPSASITMNAPFKKNGVNFISNSKGFRNREEVDYNLETVRILLLGDSFSNGYRMDQEKFFGNLLEKYLSQTCPHNIQVLNAEIAHPGLGLYYLKKYGLKFNPQIVVYGLCGNDILQSFIFVGKDKLFLFNENDELVINKDFDKEKGNFYSYIKYFQGVKYIHQLSLREKLIEIFSVSLDNYYGSFKQLNLFQPLIYLKYKYFHDDGETMTSYLSNYETVDGYLRLFNGNSNFGFYLKSQPEIASQMLCTFQKIILSIKKICDSNNIEFFLINFPQRFQINSRDWHAEKKKWRLKEEDFDLEKLNRQIFDFCEKNSIYYIDLLHDFKKEAQFQQLFLPGGDMHFNEKGHQLAAEKAAKQMINILNHNTPNY